MIKLLKDAISSKSFLVTVAFLILTDLFVLFNIPILRQFFGFFFLTFVPGFLILTALKLNKLGSAEKIVLSAGLSASFIMLFGLLVNYISLAAGYTKPLSTIAQLISFGIVTLVLAIIAYTRNKDITFALPHPGLTIREKLLLIIPMLLPLLSISGMRLMNTTGNNIILMFMLFLIPAYVIFIAFYQGNIPERLYPAFTYLIGVSIVLMLALRSNHLVGADVHESYYFFQATLANQYWSAITPSLIDSLLSISLLPAIYQLFLKINPEFLFKLLFPILVSFLPLAVYVIARKYIGSLYAFIASFFITSQVIFLWTTATSQSSLAILFFALAMMVHFHDSVNEFARRLFFLIFAVSAIVSHYSTGYIFFFVLLLTWIGTQILHQVHLHWRRRAAISEGVTAGNIDESLPTDESVNSSNRDSVLLTDKVTSTSPRTGMSITLILLFFVFIFLWHAQITNVAFDIAVNLLGRTLRSMNQSFVTEVKGTEVVAAFGQTALPSIPQQIRFVFSWLTIAFVAVGGASIAVRYKSAVAYPDSRHTKTSFLASKFELEYFVISAVCGAILAGAVVVPFVSAAYGMERPYFQSLVILSPYFVICGITIARWLRTRPYLIMLPVLIPYFMCVTGTMYQLFNVPTSFILNSAGLEYESNYVNDEMSHSAKWLAQNYVGGVIYTDLGKLTMLSSQGQIPKTRIRSLPPSQFVRTNSITGYIYLRYPLVIKGEAVPSKFVRLTAEPFPDLLTTRNELYSDGLVEIYR